jgi:hypothetical protein
VHEHAPVLTSAATPWLFKGGLVKPDASRFPHQLVSWSWLLLLMCAPHSCGQAITA